MWWPSSTTLKDGDDVLLPECPSPHSARDYEDLASDTLRTLLSLDNGNG